MADPSRRGMQPLGQILGELIARRGLARLRGQEQLEESWRRAARAVVGELVEKYTRVGALRRGALEILVANSVLLQELAGFHKEQLLAQLQAAGTGAVRELRFRLDEPHMA